jgi:DME family drug/metabolite transporter
MKKYDFSILAAGCMWGIIGLFTRHLNAMGLNSQGVLIIRSGGCAIFFALTLLFKDPKLFRVKPRDFLLLFCFGASTLFFTYCYYQSIKLASMGVACTLMYCAPAFVMVLSVFVFKEKFTGRKLAALLCSIAGCCFVSGLLEGSANVSVAGVGYGLLSGLGYAVYSVLSKILSGRGNHSLTMNFYCWGLCCVGAILLWGVGPTVQTFAAAGNVFVNILICIAMVAVSGYAPAFLYNWGLKGVEASKGSVMASVEPVVASIAGFAVFGEEPTVLGVLGIALVLGAVVILNVKPRARKAAA